MIFECIDASFAIKDGRQSASSSPSRWTSPVNTSGGVDNVSGWEKTLDPEVEILYNIYMFLMRCLHVPPRQICKASISQLPLQEFFVAETVSAAQLCKPFFFFMRESHRREASCNLSQLFDIENYVSVKSRVY